MSPQVHVGPVAELCGRLAALLEDRAKHALARRGLCAVALPGGSVGDIFFPKLAAAQCDWGRMRFFWTDERAVPPDHEDSNYGLARRLWLDPAGVPPGNVHRMPAEMADAAQAAIAYEQAMIATLGAPPRLDLALLGMGPDGHVCSLFPGHALLREERRFVAALSDSPKPPPRRLTLTLPALRAADMVVLAAMGEGKARAIREALEDPSSQLPAALALRGAAAAVVLLDPPAAAGLGAVAG